ncbi:hypothetical protein KPL70_003588 [Citrus sinensis]|nr:hypothetical protein KPL70_003588 [Citrus sinensis]
MTLIVEDHPSDQASQTDLMPPPVQEHSTKPSLASWFTFDDIPCHKWSARLQEFAAWIDLQGTKPNAQPLAVLREFMARSTGSLRDWLESLREYRQIQFMESPIGTALNIIHEQFIGEKTASTDADRKDYHHMKCCSLKRHLLDAHYKRMSILFYKLNGFNEPSLKHVFIASLPSELQPDLQRKLTATNLSIADIWPCYLLKKSDEKKCVCPTTKKRHFQKHFHKKSSSKKPFWYFKKKDISQYRKKKSNCCFFCKKRGHFARNCPHKSAKAVHLIQHLQHSSLLSENEDVESNFSEQSAQDDQTAFLIAESSDSEDISVISTVQTVNYVSSMPRPSLKMSILPYKFHKPVPVIGFIDIGADTSMIDPSVLPSDCWEHHSKLFRVVNGHFPRNCSNKSTKVVRLIEHLQKSSMLSDQEDVESNFSKQIEYDDHTAFILTVSTDDSEIDEIYVIFTVQEVNQVNSKPTAPSAKISVLPSKFHKPIPIIGFLDTGEQRRSSSSPKGILVREECTDYTNVLFQDAQDPWEDFHSLLPSQESLCLPPEPVSQLATDAAEKDELDEDYLIYQEIRKARKQYEKETGDISPSRFPSTP